MDGLIRSQRTNRFVKWEKYLKMDDIPIVETIDWSDKFNDHDENLVGPIYSQGNCSSCWAHVAANLCSSWRCIRERSLRYVAYSHQQLMDCCEKNPPEETIDKCGCYLYYGDVALEWIAKNGIVELERLEYAETKNPDCFQDPDNSYFIQGCKRLGSIEEILSELQNGPVGITLDLFSEFNTLGPNQIYSGPLHKTSEWEGLHEAMAVGSGILRTTETPFLKIKNSQGPAWGSDGFALVDLRTMIRPPDYRIDGKAKTSSTKPLIRSGMVPILSDI